MRNGNNPEEIFRKILSTSQAEETEVTVESTEDSLTRFANNTIHQNVSEERISLTVRVVVDRRTASASTNRLDEASLRRSVEAATRMARLQPPDPEWLSMAEPQTCPPSFRFSEKTASVSPEERANTVRTCIAHAEKEKLTAAGIFSTGTSSTFLFNSRGVARSHKETSATFSMTVEGETSSGWAKQSAPRVEAFQTEELARRAVEKTLESRNPRELPPGKYNVILEPSAVLDLLGFLVFDFGGLSVYEKRSCLTDRVGQQVFGKNITLVDDAYHPLQAGLPFDGEGVPRRRVPLVERGVVRNLVYARKTARRMNTEPTGHGFPLPNEEGEAPLNVVFEGGNTSLEEMIQSTERGILVTRLWYIREVDPYRKILTGMTRDGTFYVEDGKVRYGLRNFRFNEGLVDMLNRVEMIGPTGRASGEETFDMVVPALKVRDFNFSSVTKF